MRRIFGAPKKDAPVATIDETTDKLVSRGDRVDEQIKKLDEQLMKYKEQIKKTRPGPAQDAIKRRALQDDMFDMMDMSKEINEAMSRSYEVPEDVDESDLMAELDGLEEEL
ncbi:uncharacterized protein HaLaN_29467, partial [Haematococcus lacustris]